MPTDWIKKEKSLACEGGTPSVRVSTGKAIAAPPSEVAPATIAPKHMVRVMSHLGESLAPVVPAKICHLFVAPM